MSYRITRQDSRECDNHRSGINMSGGSGKSCYNEEQVLSSKSCQVITHQLLNDTDRCMSRVNITSMYITIQNENIDTNI